MSSYMTSWMQMKLLVKYIMDQQMLELLRAIHAGDHSKISQLDRLYRRIGLMLCPCPECVCLKEIAPADILCEDCADDHWPHSYNCKCRLCQISLYKEWNSPEIMLELHANRTWWKCEVPADVAHDPEYFGLLIDLAAEDFTQQTGVELHLLGRHGRHVCVEDTLENRDNYWELRELALQIEQGVVESYNEEMANIDNEENEEN